MYIYNLPPPAISSLYYLLSPLLHIHVDASSAIAGAITNLFFTHLFWFSSNFQKSVATFVIVKSQTIIFTRKGCIF